MKYQYQHLKTKKLIELDQPLDNHPTPKGYERVWSAYFATEKGGKVKKRYKQRCDYVSPNDDSKPYSSAFKDYTK